MTTYMWSTVEKSKYEPNNYHLDEIPNVENSVPLCSRNELKLRFLCSDDLEEVRTLCQDWFPIVYPMSWYEEITSSTRFFALAAVYNLTIIGLIVAEIQSYNKLNKDYKDILSDGIGRDAEIGYILSLGVHKSYRRNGIGSLLLDTLINHLTTVERYKVKSIFLHVLCTNHAAISFYEKRKFVKHQFLPYYYNIRGKAKDGFAYVLYINDGHPPLSLIDKLGTVCSKMYKIKDLGYWLIIRIRSVTVWICNRTLRRFNFSH